MSFFKKKKSGTSSHIEKLRSPYLKKLSLPERVLRRSKKKTSLLIPPAKLKGPRKKHPILWIILILLIIAGSVELVFFSNFFNLKSWETIEDGTRLENDDPINQILASERNKNILFIDDGNITTQIKTLHPDIQKIEVKKILPQKIRVEFEKYPIAANIFNRSGGTQKKLLIDSIGLIVDQNNENPELPYIKIASTDPLQIGDLAMSTDKLDYVTASTKAFEQMFTMKILDSEYKSREREVHLRTEKYFTVWLDMEKPFQPQFEKLKKALGKLDIYNTPLEYIDLRISGTDNEKIIFKRRAAPTK